MPSLREHLSNRDLRAYVKQPGERLLDALLADIQKSYESKALEQGDTDYAKGQLNAIKTLRKDIENMKLDTDAETPEGDT